MQAAVPEHQTAFRTHLHDITSNHINASGLISQPADSLRHSDKRGVGWFSKPRRRLLQSVLTWARAERELFHLNVRSRLRTVGRRLLQPRINRILHAEREADLSAQWRVGRMCIVEGAMRLSRTWEAKARNETITWSRRSDVLVLTFVLLQRCNVSSEAFRKSNETEFRCSGSGLICNVSTRP